MSLIFPPFPYETRTCPLPGFTEKDFRRYEEDLHRCFLAFPSPTFFLSPTPRYPAERLRKAIRSFISYAWDSTLLPYEEFKGVWQKACVKILPGRYAFQPLDYYLKENDPLTFSPKEVKQTFSATIDTSDTSTLESFMSLLEKLPPGQMAPVLVGGNIPALQDRITREGRNLVLTPHPTEKGLFILS